MGKRNDPWNEVKGMSEADMWRSIDRERDNTARHMDQYRRDEERRERAQRERNRETERQRWPAERTDG